MAQHRKRDVFKIKPEAHDRPFEFRRDITRRLVRVMGEFTEGFELLSSLRRPVTFFGSARFREGSQYYRAAYELAKRLGRAGFTIVTGGGPGLMEAANRGAVDAKTQSVGLNIQLPKEQRVNRYVRRGMGFYYFFSRKTMLTTSAQAYVFFPGGFGTLDEFFSIITLMQTGKIEWRPVVLFGRDYWRKLNYFIKANMLHRHHTILPKDLSLYQIVDDVDEAFRLIKQSKQRRYTSM
ncbi:MAG: TIGR00730 family Rossman fold protein [Candidatus Kerfeldbacteria bacterium]|nr:TIGR00730 family Rossman fold protein [Candidatus Kerfeldbacteria bacterium]